MNQKLEIQAKPLDEIIVEIETVVAISGSEKSLEAVFKCTGME